MLNRENIEKEIKTILYSFDKKCNDVSFKKGIYIYGSSGSGKTQFISNILKQLNYDVVKYDAGDVRNKSLIDTITSNNISCNVLQMMRGVTKKIAIIMDEIDGMNNGDKGGINSLIKLIRQKKTKKQKLENKTMNPIICIGNYYIDKKIKELMKVCHVFELKTPTNSQIQKMLIDRHPNVSISLQNVLTKYIQGDLRKLQFALDYVLQNETIQNETIFTNIYHKKSYNEDVKKITMNLLHSRVSISEHETFMNETERTIVALLWHENIVELINKIEKNKSIPFYSKILENMCYADYIDRITFQNQIWEFNEMSSMMKTFHTNKMYHDTFETSLNHKINEIRFTKVLTKYSTEYNNSIFIFNLCQKLDMDKKDLISFFQELRFSNGKHFYDSNETMMNIEKTYFDHCEITKLDIQRMYRYLDKNIKKETTLDEITETNEDLF